MCAGAGAESADVGAVMGSPCLPWAPVIPAEAGIQDGGASRCCFFLLRETASGCAPDRAVPFLCFAKEKEPKERRPSSPVGPRGRLLCGARSLRVGQNSLRGLRPLRSNSRPKSVVDAHCARPAKPCAPRRLRRGPKSNTSLAAQAFHQRLASPWQGEAEPIKPMRSEAGWCSSPPSDELRGTGLCGARVSAHQQLTSRHLFECGERSERSEFGAAAKTEQRKAALAQRGPRRLGSLLCPLSCRYKKVGRPPGRTPGAASRSGQEQRQSAQGFDTPARASRGAQPSWIPAFAGMTPPP